MTIDRRSFLAMGAAALLAACSGEQSVVAPRPITIGLVSPKTGPAQALSGADDEVVRQLRGGLVGGIAVGKTTYPVEIQHLDSGSTQGGASAAATQLIDSFGALALVGAHDVATVLGVSEIAEARGVPCLTTMTAWEPWLSTRSDPDQGFIWSHHLGWGLSDVRRVWTDLWSVVPTGGAGMLVYDDLQGDLVSKGEFVGPLESASGRNVVVPPRVSPLPETFRPVVDQLIAADAAVVGAVLGPRDLVDARRDGAAAGFTPVSLTGGPEVALPTLARTLGDLVVGVTAAVPWMPTLPFAASGLSMDAAELGRSGGTEPDAVAATWTSGMGPVHAAFESLLEAFVRSGDPLNHRAVATELSTLRLATVAGPIAFDTGPVPGVAELPLFGVQWQQSNGARELKVASSDPRFGIAADVGVEILPG